MKRSILSRQLFTVFRESNQLTRSLNNHSYCTNKLKYFNPKISLYKSSSCATKSFNYKYGINTNIVVCGTKQLSYVCRKYSQIDKESDMNRKINDNYSAEKNDMETFIQKYLELNNCKYIKIENHEIVNHIYNLYKYDVSGRDSFKMEDSIIDFYYGLYYSIKKKYDQMEKYYLMAIEKGNNVAMNNLGFYYQYEKKDYDQMEKYYLMAIEKGNSDAMNNLGLYYEDIKKNYDQTKKYYLMSIEKGNDCAMNNLGLYYMEIEKDYKQMKKYYLMAIERENSDAMNNLGFYYKKIEKDYDQMKKYYLMAIGKGHSGAMLNLAYYYKMIKKDYDQMEKYYCMAIKKGNINAVNNYKFYFGDLKNCNPELPFLEKLIDKFLIMGDCYLKPTAEVLLIAWLYAFMNTGIMLLIKHMQIIFSIYT